MITTVITTDGRRDCFARMIESLDRWVAGMTPQRFVWDDSGDPAYREWLRETAGPMGFQIIGAHPGQVKLGQDRALQRLWKLLAKDHRGWIFHVEDDFVFERGVDLRAMINVVERRQLAQMSLLRQPWFPGELRAGGVIERNPDAFTGMSFSGEPHRWIEHRSYFTLNPCVYPRSLTLRGWPTGRRHEARFASDLFDSNGAVHCGIWGDGTPWIQHIGAERTGHGY